MAVSDAVLRYYAQRIYARSGRDRAPPNFLPPGTAPTGRATVEGCRGGGKNVLEVLLVADAERIRDVRVSCGLCNPAMLVAADVVCDWARGRALAEVLALDPFAPGALDALFGLLGGPGRPEDAREKLQYALLALRLAVHDHRGERAPPPPAVPPPPGEDDGEGGAGGAS